MGCWETEANWNRDVLERIVVLLFALAGLADRAAGAPFLRRRRVLSILNYGEAEARRLLIGTTSCTPAPVDRAATAHDAARLAARLRVLAMLLSVLLARGARFAPRVAVGPRVGREMTAGRWGNSTVPPAPDTS